ncbi:MAG TPA: heavy metal-binding domain-containing protein, partial [Actinobacteria bacterium]|nr:heavy metal-binding domain-containing protein [Actinomycetota bacterium]
MVSPIVGLLITLVMLVGLGGIGRMRERQHLENLAEREKRVTAVLVLDTAAPPLGLDPVHGELVIGNAVIGTDYLKQFFARWRNLFGGEMKAYQKVLSRARREAQLRMVEDAYDRGAR